MLDLADEPSFLENQIDVSMASGSIKSRGRKKIPLKWTRIFKPDDDDEKDLQHVVVKEDIEAIYADVAGLSIHKKKKWAPLFYTNHFLEDQQELSIDAF